MNINHLKMFVSIVNHRNISKVAEIMHISQSALSQQIRTMEQEFGASLLVRSPNGVVPTYIGSIVYQKAKEIISTYDDIFISINNAQSKNKSVHIIATPVAYSYALPCTFYHVKNNYPAYSLEVEVMTSNLIEEKISKGVGDMGIIIGKPKDKSLTYKKVFSDHVYLVTEQNSNIPPQIECEDIYNYPILMLVETQKTRQILNKNLAKIGIDVKNLNVPYTLESTESIKLSALNGYGLAFLPYMAIKKELYHKQLRIVKCDCLNIENSFYSIRRKENEHLNTELSKLITYIEKILEGTIC